MRLFALLLVVAFATFGFAADSHQLALFQPSYIGDTQLDAGDYSLTIDDSHVVIKKGRRTKAEADVKVEAGGETYTRTSVRYDENETSHIVEIRLAGTNTKLVFN
jgi:hypothetical protein